MKLLILIGNSAVGKMTVGQELAKITDMRLLHNNMSIELVLEIFGKRAGRADQRIREVIFEEFAKADNYGLIFTFMWAFNNKSDWDYIENLCNIFKTANPEDELYYAELVAPQEIRLQRNAAKNRFVNKASQSDIEASNQRLISSDEKYRFESFDGEIPFKNYIKIDNSDIPPEIAAKMIIDKFSL